jgi:predicted TIM-barrel fold metal-dependent hydrolase
MVENAPAGAGDRPAIIDAWANPPFADMNAHLPEIRRLFTQSGALRQLEAGLTAPQLVEAMDAAGIERLLLTAWTRPGVNVAANDRIAEFIRHDPQRFVGVAAVDLERPVAAVRELDRAVRQLGFKALRVIPWLWKLPPNDRLYYPLYVKCVELGVPFCTQVGHTGPLMPSETGRPIPYIDEIALTFPELKIVGGHIGYPWTDEMIALAWKHENVFIDTSAYLPRYYPPQLLHFMNTYGQDKVLFGTNFPMLSLSTCAQQALALELKPDTMRKFLGDNARRVFGI